MKICPVNTQYMNVNSSRVNTRTAQASCENVSFGAKPVRVNCKKLEGLTYDKYKNLSFLTKLKYRIRTPLMIRHDADVNYKAALKTMSYFDNLYGADNYTLMIIGRSMATIGETVGLLGRDVKLLPMSGLSNGLPANIKNVDVYRKYLESIGLTKNFIEKNPNRKFILLDFVSSGESLENAHKFLSRPDLLGNPARLGTASTQEVLNENNFLLDVYMRLLFMCSQLKAYSPVRRLELNNLDKVFESLSCSPATKDKRNLFLFNVMRKVAKYRKKTGN